MTSRLRTEASGYPLPVGSANGGPNRSILKAYGRSWTHEALAAARIVPGIAAKIENLRASAIPDQQFLDGRGQSRLSRSKRVAEQRHRPGRFQ